MIFIIFFSPKTGPYKTLCEHSDCKRENRLYSSVGIINRGPFKIQMAALPDFNFKLFLKYIAKEGNEQLKARWCVL